MDSLIYFFLAAVSVIGVFGGILYFKRDWSLDALIFPLLSLFTSLILIITSYLSISGATPLFTEVESKLMMAFWIGMMLISFVEILAITTGTFGGVLNGRN